MKAKIALITGGYTGEAEISFKSAAFVESQLDHDHYEIYRIEIGTYGWFYCAQSGERTVVDKNDFTISIGGEKIAFDLAFIMLHGTPGEDGRLQGYLDMMGVPYTTCGALTSALTMNKAFTKAILADLAEINLAKSVLLYENDRKGAEDRILSNLRLPLFVKPNGGGSSIGMSKVKVAEELSEALDKAFRAENTGRQVVVEEFVEGREFSVGIFRNLQGELIVFPSTEVITSREFFDYEAKYTPGLTEEITPAALSDEQRARVERIVKSIYTRLDCKGMVRVDYFLEYKTDKFYFIEINTVPGQTAQSFIPQQVRAAGMSERKFYSELIEVALQSNG